jgi:hypothetical protein
MKTRMWNLHCDILITGYLPVYHKSYVFNISLQRLTTKVSSFKDLMSWFDSQFKSEIEEVFQKEPTQYQMTEYTLYFYINKVHVAAVVPISQNLTKHIFAYLLYKVRR